MPVYKDHRAALLGLVRIFGPCYLSEIQEELRVLLRSNLIEELPYSWVFSKRGYVKVEIIKVLEELWISGYIVQVGERWKAVTKGDQS